MGYYETLGVPKNASNSEIKKKYRELARELHPDLNQGDKSASDHFKKINDAYDVLSDEKKRKDYDDFGDNWKHAKQMRDSGYAHHQLFRRSLHYFVVRRRVFVTIMYFSCLWVI